MTTHKERGNLAACLVELDKAHLILGEATPDGAVNDAVEHLITATSLLAAELRTLTGITVDAWDEGVKEGLDRAGAWEHGQRRKDEPNPYRNKP